MKSLWAVFAVVGLMMGCSGKEEGPAADAAGGAPNAESGTRQLTSTVGNKALAIGAVREGLQLFRVIEDGDSAAAADLVLRLAFHGGDITFQERVPFDPTQPTTFLENYDTGTGGSASCNQGACNYVGFLFGALSDTRVDGTVQVQPNAGGKSLEVNLVEQDLGPAVAGPSTISASFEASATTLSGSMTELTVNADDPSKTVDTQSIGFQDVTFDLSGGPGAVLPQSGGLHAEWTGGVDGGQQTTVSFP